MDTIDGGSVTFEDMNLSELPEDELANMGRKKMEGTAILLVTHDAKVAARAERILFMRDGCIVNELCLGKTGANGWKEKSRKIMEKLQVLGI